MNFKKPRLNLTYLVTSILITPIWFMFPFVMAFILPFLTEFKKLFCVKYLCLLISLSFGLVAYTVVSNGEIETDMMRYYDIYAYYGHLTSFQEFILAILLEGDLNFLFQILTFFVSRIFPDNSQYFALFWVSLTYFVGFLMCIELNEYYQKNKNRVDILSLLIITMVFGVMSFYTITELVKQSIAVCVFGYAISRKINEKKYVKLLICASILLHFSSFFLLPVYFFINKKINQKTVIIIFVVCLFLSFVNVVQLANLISQIVPLPGNLREKILMYTEIENWEYAKRYHFLLLVYGLVCALVYFDVFKKKEDPNKLTNVFNVLFISFCYVLINVSNLYNYIRYTLTYFPFYLFGIFGILNTSFGKKIKIIAYTVLSVFYFYATVSMLYFRTQEGGNYSNSYMDNSFVKLVCSSVFEYLNYRIVR
jgi:hypothetical protein